MTGALRPVRLRLVTSVAQQMVYLTSAKPYVETGLGSGTKTAMTVHIRIYESLIRAPFVASNYTMIQPFERWKYM